jgi:hypothetical protein
LEVDGRTVLLFEGIDTYADIYLNGLLAASTGNMLIEHEVREAFFGAARTKSWSTFARR